MHPPTTEKEPMPIQAEVLALVELDAGSDSVAQAPAR